MVTCYLNLSIFTVFLKKRKFISNIRRSKVTDYAALRKVLVDLKTISFCYWFISTKLLFLLKLTYTHKRYKMTTLPVFDFNEILIRPARYMACFCGNMISWQRLQHIDLWNWMWIVLLIFEKKYWNFIITSSENVNHILYKFSCDINKMPMIFWSQSRWKTIEINTTIDSGHRHLETGTTSTI